MRRNVRVFAGNDEHAERFGTPDAGAGSSAKALIDLLRRAPLMLPQVAVYVAGTALAKLGAKRRRRRGEAIGWSAHR